MAWYDTSWGFWLCANWHYQRRIGFLCLVVAQLRRFHFAWPSSMGSMNQAIDSELVAATWNQGTHTWRAQTIRDCAGIKIRSNAWTWVLELERNQTLIQFYFCFSAFHFGKQSKTFQAINFEFVRGYLKAKNYLTHNSNNFPSNAFAHSSLLVEFKRRSLALFLLLDFHPLLYYLPKLSAVIGAVCADWFDGVRIL